MNKRRVDYLKGETLPLEIILAYKYGTTCRNQTHAKRVGSSCAIITPRSHYWSKLTDSNRRYMVLQTILQTD